MAIGIHTIPVAQVTTQFDKTNSAVLANITGLSQNLYAGRTYIFEAILFVNADVVGGSQFAIAGTATATTIIYEITLTDDATLANTITARKTTLAGAAGQAGTTAGLCRIVGLIKCNAAGTFTVQFAQNAATPATTSSILVGSYFNVQTITS